MSSVVPVFTATVLPETFNSDLLEALASGQGPDIFFITDDLIWSYANKIFVIPYESFPLSSFKNSFAGAGEVFLTSQGILAFPISIDPLMLYYNRSMLDANNIVYPPAFWDELVAIVPLLNERNESNQLTRGAVAMGQFANITHAKDILATLFMQAGNPVVEEVDGFLRSSLGQFSGGSGLGPVLEFYTDFADPLQTSYAWNRSFPNSSEAFSSEKLAFYFGFASEFPSLVSRNPNQDFLVATVPQIKGTNFKLTSARVTGLAVSAFSRNLETALLASSLMATGNFAEQFSSATGVAPARRDLIARSPGGAYLPTFYQSALFARSWLDPNPIASNDIFRIMIESVLSGVATPADSVRDASGRLELLLFR